MPTDDEPDEDIGRKAREEAERRDFTRRFDLYMQRVRELVAARKKKAPRVDFIHRHV